MSRIVWSGCACDLTRSYGARPATSCQCLLATAQSRGSFMSIRRHRSALLKKLDMDLWASEMLFCTSCGAEVVRERARVNIAGSHRHIFFDRKRLKYTVCCFSAADSCRTIDSKIRMATWFPGYAWQVVFCQRCSIQLGWRFNSVAGGHRFFGLLKDRLVRLGQGFVS